MAVKRKTYRFRKGEILDVEEYHDGNYGAPGVKRGKRAKPTPEQIQKVNAANKRRRCRQRLLQYFSEGDCFATLTYQLSDRPESMEEAKTDFNKLMRKVRREYKKKGVPLYWIRNIEQGTRGAWHIHLVITETGGTASILQRAWKKGGVYVSQIRFNDKIYDEDFTKLASYMTKDEHAVRLKKDGTPEKPRISEASYSTSRNMPLPEPKIDKLHRWKEEPKPKKGYYIASIHEGINPVTGYKYRRYTMVRLKGGRNVKKHHTGQEGVLPLPETGG